MSRTRISSTVENPRVNADSLMEQGILEIINTPIDGAPTKYPEIMKAEVAGLAVRAAFNHVTIEPRFTDFESEIETTAFHSVIVRFEEPIEVERKQSLFNVLVSSVLGGHQTHPTKEIDELAFLLSLQANGGYGVSTVSGIHKGLAPLTDEMSQEAASLLALSMDYGEVKREREAGGAAA
jgi:hypothetical protein